MPKLRNFFNRDFLRGMAQAFDLTGSLASERLRDMRERMHAGGVAGDWERVNRDLYRVLQRYAAARVQ
ncbi:MAG TPA: hypothetical protein VFS20_00770 [Longimicrobium sp.]|nr:hypothetical protein [Longimicrobium sp.]